MQRSRPPPLQLSCDSGRARRSRAVTAPQTSVGRMSTRKQTRAKDLPRGARWWEEKAGKGGSSAPGRAQLCQLGQCGRLLPQPRVHQPTCIQWRLRTPQVPEGSMPSPEGCGYDMSQARAWHWFKPQLPGSGEAGHTDALFPRSLSYLRNFKILTTQHPI